MSSHQNLHEAKNFSPLNHASLKNPVVFCVSVREKYNNYSQQATNTQQAAKPINVRYNYYTNTNVYANRLNPLHIECNHCMLLNTLWKMYHTTVEPI